MTTGGPDNEWPGPDDQLVVTEMLNKRNSPHWEQCCNFVERLIQASNLPVEHREDAVQKVMLAVMRYLPGFRYEGRLRNWLGKVVRTHVIDEFREIKHDIEWITHMNDSSEENEADLLDREIKNSLPTPEEICIKREELHEVVIGLQAYVDSHRHPERNRIIVQKVLLEDYSREEVAQQVGTSTEMVGYIVRTAQSYLRKNRGY
jgi:RNA polymerase sigma factor (sigma-70 family)